MNPTTALIVVNAQGDLLPGGILGRATLDRVLPNLAKLGQDVDLVIATKTLHQPNHFTFSQDPEFKDGSWPPHLISGTSGAELHQSIRKVADYVVTMGMSPQAPDDYSAFQATTLRPIEGVGDILRRHGVQNVIVGGFGWCVAPTAFDANALGFRTFVYEDGAILSDETKEKLTRAGVIIYHKATI